MLGRLEYGAPSGLRKIRCDKSLGRVEVVLPRFIDDAQVAKFLGLRIRKRDVNLPAFEGNFVARIVETDVEVFG